MVSAGAGAFGSGLDRSRYRTSQPDSGARFSAFRHRAAGLSRHLGQLVRRTHAGRAPGASRERPHASGVGRSGGLPEGGRRMNLSLAESMIHAASLEIAGKREEALAELCQARDAGHHTPKLYGAIGHLQFELRRFQAAAGAYEEALRLDGDDATTHYNRAVCLERLDAWEDAAACLLYTSPSPR